MQYQPIHHQGAAHSNNGNLSGHLPPHTDHYTLTPAHTPHSSATKPRSRTFHEMVDEDDQDVDHQNQHLHSQHQHHHHQLPNHNGYHHQPDQPPPLKIQRADFEDLLGRTSMPMGGPGSLLGGPPTLQTPGQPSAQMFAPGLGNSSHLSPIEPMRQSQNGPPMMGGPLTGSPHLSQNGQTPVSAGVGAPGMPLPMPRPRGPKLKFTPEDDALLLELKENRALTWKQIAEFFPGRSSGTLQVRYCTKLKAKTTQWTDDTVQRLRNAMQEYENDRWRLIAAKVGNGFSPAACREKSKEI